MATLFSVEREDVLLERKKPLKIAFRSVEDAVFRYCHEAWYLLTGNCCCVGACGPHSHYHAVELLLIIFQKSSECSMSPHQPNPFSSNNWVMVVISVFNFSWVLFHK